MLQYKNSLIGRQLKAIQQLGIFCLANSSDTPNFGVSKDLFDLWKYNGELGALLWVPEITDMKSYLVSDFCEPLPIAMLTSRLTLAGGRRYCNKKLT
jgi:hypothetical protein